MDCTHYKEQVSAFVDNELDPESQTRLFDHLASCSECHLFLDSLMKFKSMKHQEELEFPEEVDEHLFEEINRRKFIYKLGKSGIEVRPPFWKRRVTLPVPTLTAILAALLIGISALFANLLAQGAGSKAQLVQNSRAEQNVERRETIVYGVSGVTVYGHPGAAQKTGL
jgi:hypothetical protein